MKSRKHLTPVLIICGLLITVYALETLMIAKDADLFLQAKQWGLVDDEEGWMVVHLARFWLHILLPLILSLHTYFFYSRTSPGMFRGVYTVLTAAAAIQRLVEWQTASVFYWLTLVLYALLIYAIQRLRKPLSSEGS